MATIIGRKNLGAHLGVGNRLLDRLLARPDFPVARLTSGSLEYIVTTDKLIELWAVSQFGEKVSGKIQDKVHIKRKQGLERAKINTDWRYRAIERMAEGVTYHTRWEDE